MFSSTNAFIVTLLALPTVFGQGTNTTASTPSNRTTSTTSNNSTTSPNESTAASSAPFTPNNFTPSIVSGTTCGSAQQNLNECTTKVGKDISSCTDNTCLCQTYANIAACYNGCAELVDQGKQYQAQSAQYCTIAGVKPNTNGTVTAPVATTSSTPTTPTSFTTTPLRTNTTSTPSTPNSNAGAFSAAKSSAAIPDAQSSKFGLLAILASASFAVFL